MERRPARGGVWAFSAVLIGVAGLAIGVATITSRAADMVHDRVWATEAPPTGWPDEPADVQSNPLGTPPPVEGDGAFAFLSTQRGSDDPVTYSPCQPIHLVVNARTAVPGHEEILDRALAEVSRATGLTFVVDGPTDRVSEQRMPRRGPDGRGWEPVLIAWSDEEEVPELAGSTIGLGGSTTVTKGDHAWLVTGTVTIDGPDASRLVDRPNGPAELQAVIMHELGHLVGLDHVDDRDELMFGQEIGQVAWGDGDRAGLAKLGSGQCVDW